MKTKHPDQKMVRLYLGGVTGSSVVCSERYLREYDTPRVVNRPFSRQIFGSHTTSIGIIVGSTGIIVDNGTGVGQVSEWLKAQDVNQVFIFQTHYHLDHIAGLVTNSFLLRKSVVKGIYGPKLGQFEIAGVMKQLFAPPYWPVSPSMFRIEHPFISFNPGETIPIMGGVKTILLNHAGGSVGYRISTPGGDIVIATDNELSNGDIRETTADFIKESAIAYLDVQYRDVEYQGVQSIGPGNTTLSRKNWGHSTPSMLQQTYQLMNDAPRLTLIGHHDPKRPDEDLFKFEGDITQSLTGLGTRVVFAKEHDVYELPYVPALKRGGSVVTA